MLFYSPEDPIEIPYPLERTLHRSQWLPSLMIAAGSTLLLLGLPAHAGTACCWGVVFCVALAASLAVPLWCGIRYDRSLPSHTLGGLRALALWMGCQGLLLALSLVTWGLVLDAAGLWPDFQRPALPSSVPVPALAPAPLSQRAGSPSAPIPGVRFPTVPPRSVPRRAIHHPIAVRSVPAETGSLPRLFENRRFHAPGV
ncbi:MAG: hypothetical protein ACKOFW_22130 [Planctomycetaceae bacterium]